MNIWHCFPLTSEDGDGKAVASLVFVESPCTAHVRTVLFGMYPHPSMGMEDSDAGTWLDYLTTSPQSEHFMSTRQESSSYLGSVVFLWSYNLYTFTVTTLATELPSEPGWTSLITAEWRGQTA